MDKKCKKVLSAIFCLLLTIMASAQQESVNRYAVSGRAGELSRASQVPVNGSSGQVRFRLPVEVIRSGALEWPVSLDYSFNGLRLEQAPSDVGLGWNLSGAGGAIVREVRGLPDDHPRGYWGSQSRRSYVSAYAKGTDMPLAVVQEFSSGLYDSEPDRFVVAAGPLSFSFVIQEVGCISCAYADQQIKVTPDPNGARVNFRWDEIEITDNAGVIYLFRTREIASFSSPHAVNMEAMPEYTSAWHLSRVTPVSGRAVEFEYASAVITPVSFMEQYDRTASAQGVQVDIDCGPLGGSFNTGIRTQQQFRELLHFETSHTSEVRVPYPVTVRWVDGSLEIMRSAEPTINGVPQVVAIELRDRFGKRVRRTMLEMERQSRTLLGRVMTDSLVVHEFEYAAVNTPHVLSPSVASTSANANPYAQDLWGFANGAANKTSIPFLGADRTPDFQAARQGALTKIIWPTGGTTEITYEPNRVRVTPAEMSELEPRQPNFSRSFSFRAKNGQRVEESATIVLNKLTWARLSHQAFLRGSSARVSFTFGPLEGCDGRNCQDVYRYATSQRQLDPVTAPRFTPLIGVELTGDVIQSGCGEYFNSCDRNALEDWIRIEPGTYLVTAVLDGGESAEVSLQLDWYDPDPDGKNPPWYDVDAAGIRVAQTSDCAGDDSPCVKRLFKYQHEDGYSSGRWLNKIDMEYAYQVYDAFDCRDMQAANQSGSPALPLYFEWQYPATSYQFRTLNPLLFLSGSPVAYSRLELWDDEQKSRGREVMHFNTGTSGLSGQYPYVPNQQDPSDGSMWKQQFFRAGDDVVTRETEETTVNRSMQDLTTPLNGLVIGRHAEYKYVPTGGSDQVNQLLLQSYRLAAYPITLPARQLTLRQTERSEDGRHIRERHFRYNDKLMLRADSTVNSDGVWTKTQYSYPYEFNDAVSQALVSLNRIGQPIRSETIIDGKIRSNSQAVYRQWGSTIRSTDKDRVEITKDGTKFIDVQIVARTTDGFPSEVVDRNGIRTAVLWDANGRDRLAVAEGASANEIYYNGFESDVAVATTTDARTGKRSASAGFNLSLTGLTPGKTYLLRWWLKTGGSWVMQEREIPIGKATTYATVLTGQVDDVRFHPVDAQMTTYTVDPHTGITSETDSNGITRHFRYDSLGRLIMILDAKGNILRRHQYRMQRQLAGQ